MRESFNEKFQAYNRYIKEIILFSLPIMIGNIGHMLIGAGDIFVAARYSTTALSALSIANALIMTITIAGMGLLYAVSPVLANYRGEGKPTKRYFWASFIYSCLLALIFAGITYLFAFIVPLFGFEEKLVPLIQDYLKICSLSVFGMYLYAGMKEFLQSFEIVTFPNIIAIMAIFFNIAFNFTFVFGLGNIPALGVNGLAIASVLTRSLMAVILLGYCINFLKTRVKLQKTYLKHLFKIGYPISTALLLEFTAFNLITILLGKISGIYAGVNNIILTWSGITFMIPLAISNALAVKVAVANGQKNFLEIKRLSIVGIALITVLMSLCAGYFILFPESLVKVFTSDPEIIRIAVSVFTIVAAFQVFDGVQIALGGILKGLKITKPLLVGVIVGYWIIGLPLGYFLAFKLGLNIIGFWIGLALALFTISILLGVVFYRKLKELTSQ